MAKNFPAFMEPEDILRFSKKPVILPYPELDEVSPHLHTLFL
jgi:hypothetical protein